MGERADDELATLPGTPWQAWRDAVLRSAGFPIDGVGWFAAPALAAAADAVVAAGDAGSGPGDRAAFDAAFDAAVVDLGRAVHRVASDPAFRAAVSWQNPAALDAATGVLRDGPDGRRTAHRRRREETIAKYWQRYCIKNDTIGFFGPICWVRLEPDAPAVTLRPGPGLVRSRHVFLERWALVALADRLADDDAIRPWLPVRRPPYLAISGAVLRAPIETGLDGTVLHPAQAALVARCDGRAGAHELAAALVADPDAGFRRTADVYAALDELVSRGVLARGVDLPDGLCAEAALRAHVEAIGDPAARDRARSWLESLSAARDELATAGPDEVAGAIRRLEEVFEHLTGAAARRRPGETYAGRTLCHLDAVRDLDVTFGGPVLAALAGLEPLLRSVRWLTATIARTYRDALGAIYDDLAADAGSPEVPLAEVWYLAWGTVFGDKRPIDDVLDDFFHRWSRLLDPAAARSTTAVDGSVDGDPRRLWFDPEAFARRAAAEFPADAGDGWQLARLHAPDVHLCARDAEALRRGDFTVVLGELHAGTCVFDTDFFRIGHPAPQRLQAGMHRDVPHGRVRPLVPPDVARHTARNTEWMRHPDDIQLGYTAADGADPERLVPLPELTVCPGDAGPVVRAPGGRAFDLVETFAELLGATVLDSWKLAGERGHTPRVTIGSVVLIREMWRTTAGDTGLAEATGERDRYLAVRRFRRRHDLPERVFVRVATEVKPCYVDLTSPVYARILCTMLRSAVAKAGPATEVVVTELLPTPEDAWLTDAGGRRYSSELRLQLRDPTAG